MTRHVVSCEGARSRGRRRAGEEYLALSIHGNQANLRLSIEDISRALMREIPPRWRDLLRIAAYVYGADTSVDRGTPSDVFADGWKRDFRFVVPVLDIDFWSAPAVTERLVDTLEYLTGDHFAFDFVRGGVDEGQLTLSFADTDSRPNDSVTLFSGGLDSLGAVVRQVAQGRRPLLVSHRAVSIVDARQKNLVAELRRRYPEWTFPHVRVWASRGGTRAVEPTQRSRPFIYLALAGAVASQTHAADIQICDNGVMSVNLPRLTQTISSMGTRSTHPLFLDKVEGLLRMVAERRLPVRNAFIHRTRAEVLCILRDHGAAPLIEMAVSCAHTEGMTNVQKHCGVCSQCIDRRFAALTANLVEFDPPERYQKDVFLEPLDKPGERQHAESYVRFAKKLADLTPESFVEAFPQIEDCLLAAESADSEARALAEMHRRHGMSVLTALADQLKVHSRDFVTGALPETCLLSLVASRAHLQPERETYARRLGAILAAGLPKAFRESQPKNESIVQDNAEALFTVAQETLKRELPLLPFAAVTTKPDFADQKDTLFVEMKYPKSRSELRRIQTEMTSRVTVYGDQGAAVLFVVYDPRRAIRDDNAFAAAFEKHANVWVTIVR